jgi:hypothetical protein
MDTTRRRVLQAGLAAASLFTWPRAGSSQSAAPLLGLPRIALVVGNGAYRDVPLRNPANDARAISSALSSTGFTVTTKLDLPRAELAAALNAHVAELTRRRAVGLVYYAGHGVQLAWRNYMLGVDAQIAAAADVPAQGVDVASLLDGLGASASAMNVIILDACRDNPFPSLEGVDQKGLSQMDAPRSTLLAYATSPGNVASDGAGANSLYTEHLAREMQVREAKIEDVFKRVRLAVRRQSSGAQIPWESTSLEDDFYFIPPTQVAAPSDAERQRQFDNELRVWQRARGAGQPAPLEEYLREYPSGRFAELAQMQLDRVLMRGGERRVRPVPAAGNPFTRGSAMANTGWRVGDSYAYRVLDRLTGADDRTQVYTVSEITDSEVRFGNGQVVDLLGNTLRRPGGRVYTPNQLEPMDYAVGKRWRTEFGVSTPKGLEGRTMMDLRITARERVTVPAGTFEAFRTEGRGVLADGNGHVIEDTQIVKWTAPDRLRMPVAIEETRTRRGRRPHPGQSLRLELARFREA